MCVSLLTLAADFHLVQVFKTLVLVTTSLRLSYCSLESVRLVGLLVKCIFVINTVTFQQAHTDFSDRVTHTHRYMVNSSPHSPSDRVTHPQGYVWERSTRAGTF